MTTRTFSSFRKSSRLVTGLAAASMLATAAGSVFPAAAQTVVATNPPVSQQTVPALKPIPDEQCKYVAVRFTETLKKNGVDYISDVTRKAMVQFLVSAPETRKFDCAGPREIPWTNDRTLG